MRARTTPPAMAEATCPAALAPMACMRTKFPSSSLVACCWTTRAAIGKALIPAAPINGLNFPREKTLSSFPNIRRSRTYAGGGV